MNINYEALFWVLLFINVIGIWMIARLLGKIDNLHTLLTIHDSRVKNIQDDVIRVTACISDIHDDLRDHDTATEGGLNLIQSSIDDLFEDEDDEEWTPEPEEKYPEPGEVVELGNISIEVDEIPIHLITPNQFFFEAGRDKFELEYDSVSDTLRYYYGPEDCEKSIVIGNIDECIGDGLKFFGVNSKNDEVAYVRNNIFNADFMIVKVD